MAERELARIDRVLGQISHQLNERRIPRTDGHEFLALLEHNETVSRLDKIYPRLGLGKRLRLVAEKLQAADITIERDQHQEFRDPSEIIIVRGPVDEAIKEIERAQGELHAVKRS